MYKTSNDRRFRKNKKAIQRAYIDLVVEKGYQNITITDISERADINRMTFYAHYDAVEDIFTEFVDDMEEQIKTSVQAEQKLDLEKFFSIMNELMYKEECFFRYVAKEGNCSDFREAFRKAIRSILLFEERKDSKSLMVERDLYATCISYAYLDWLSGTYGDMELSEVISVTNAFLVNSGKFMEVRNCRKISCT